MDALRHQLAEQLRAGHAPGDQHLADARIPAACQDHAAHRARQQVIDLPGDVLFGHIALFDPPLHLRFRAGEMAMQILIGHVGGELRLAPALHGQLFQVRPCRERQSQRHAHAIHKLPGVQIQRAAQQRQVIPTQAKQLGGAAGEMHRHQVALRHAAVHHGRRHVAALMGGRKARDAKHSGQAASLSIPHLKHGHIGFFLVPGLARRAHRHDLVTLGVCGQLLQPFGQLTDMNEHGLALSQAAFTLFHRQ